MPLFKTSPNNNTFLSVPYYKALSHDKDITFTPRFYAKDQLLLQTEYRTIGKNSKSNTDFSIFNEKGEFHGVVKEWYKSGQIFRDFNYAEGKELGSQRMWKNDGTLKANYEVVNGERFGLIGLKKCYTVTVDSVEVK